MYDHNDKDDSIFEGYSQSILDVVEEKYKTRKNLIHRLVYIGKLRETYGDQNSLADYYEKMVKNLNNNTQSEVLTGILLVFPKHFVHVIETFNDVIRTIMKDIENSSTMDGPVSKAKILVISHDVPHRLYNMWHCKVLDVQAAKIDLYEPTDSNNRLVLDILEQVLNLGNHLAKQPKLNLKNALDSLHEKVPEHLPQQDIVGYLVETNDQCMITPKEYLDQYQTPVDVILDSEMTWPMPIRLFPYN